MHIKFDEKTHRYCNNNTGEQYISATQLLSQFKKPFDKDFYATRVAKREGISKELVLEMWEHEKEKSCIKGKTFHSFLENYVKFGETVEGYNWLYKTFETQREILVGSCNKIYTEKLLWNDEYKLAGTCDLLYEHKDSFTIIDYKTNKHFSSFSKYGEYLLSPIDFLTNCEYNVYALQLSLYAYMFELMSNKKVRNLHILYLQEDRFTPYTVPYMKMEIDLLLKTYINK
jgi:ATP-dependent exoDNAse (exonuclease V) beta subunit